MFFSASGVRNQWRDVAVLQVHVGGKGLERGGVGFWWGGLSGPSLMRWPALMRLPLHGEDVDPDSWVGLLCLDVEKSRSLFEGALCN